MMEEEQQQKVDIRPTGPEDTAWMLEFIKERWSTYHLYARGREHNVAELKGFAAVRGEEILGLATYQIQDRECEILSVNSLVEGLGFGTELLKSIAQASAAAGCKRISVVVTNDNINGLRFFQTRGFILAKLNRNIAESYRDLDADYPTRGQENIPVRDELELEINF